MLMRTTIEKAFVRYEVVRDGLVVWSEEVRFGHRRELRAGGRAFREAARRQELTCQQYRRTK